MAALASPSCPLEALTAARVHAAGPASSPRGKARVAVAAEGGGSRISSRQITGCSGRFSNTARSKLSLELSQPRRFDQCAAAAASPFPSPAHHKEASRRRSIARAAAEDSSGTSASTGGSGSTVVAASAEAPAAAPSAASGSASAYFTALEGAKFLSAATGEEVEAQSLWSWSSPRSAIVLVFLTHFADLTTAEYAQFIVRKILPEIKAKQSFSVPVSLVAVGLGSVENARKFSELQNFPLDMLYADPDGATYKKLEFSPGFAPEAPVSPYLKLLPMLAGIGSPGTIQEVLRGYVGDSGRTPVFDGSTPFDILGGGYQRPFELATQRLINMNTVLSNWGSLAPAKEQLLTQQGGTFVFKGTECTFAYKDTGILKYANVDEVAAAIRAL